jgi:glucosamine--fructose-6-phosphate aminotransferase (isomerizing)
MSEPAPTPDRAAHPFHTYDMIFEIPKAIQQTLQALKASIPAAARNLADKRRIYFTGCGTAYFSSILGSQVYSLTKSEPERFLCVPALELQKHTYQMDRESAIVGISHSGITKTTVDALKYAKENDAHTIGITHFADRPISDAVDETLVAGNSPDISRCHTKCYVASAVACMQIGIELTKRLEKNGDTDRLDEIEAELNRLPEITSNLLKSVDGLCRRLAEEYVESDSYYFAGTGPNVPNALEAALKIMETSYVPAQGFETEQLLHGPWMSIDGKSTVVVLAPNDSCRGRNMDLLKAANQIGAPTISLIDEGDSEVRSLCHDAIELPATDEYLSPFINIIPLYLFAYYSCVSRGLNPDLLRYTTPAYWRARQIVFPPGTH